MLLFVMYSFNPQTALLRASLKEADEQVLKDVYAMCSLQGCMWEKLEKYTSGFVKLYCGTTVQYGTTSHTKKCERFF